VRGIIRLLTLEGTEPCTPRAIKWKLLQGHQLITTLQYIHEKLNPHVEVFQHTHAVWLLYWGNKDKTCIATHILIIVPVVVRKCIHLYYSSHCFCNAKGSTSMDTEIIVLPWDYELLVWIKAYIMHCKALQLLCNNTSLSTTSLNCFIIHTCIRGAETATATTSRAIPLYQPEAIITSTMTVLGYVHSMHARSGS
jgi:hypothetical protein